MEASSRSRGWRNRADQAARLTGRHLQEALGGEQRTRVIVVLACVLALSSADASTVGAAASPLRSALHIGNTDIGLLVTVSSIVAALCSIPFGVLADRFPRTRTLGFAIVLWGVAMIWSSTATSFGRLLLARLFLGGVTAASGPIIASLTGDYFAAGERGRIYSYILTGELIGAGIGFSVTGDIAALSWRLAFVLLAIPAFILAWYVFRLPEPVRGGHKPLPGAPVAVHESTAPEAAPNDDTPAPTDAMRLAARRGIKPDRENVIDPSIRKAGLITAARAVLSIRTNVVLIVASACGYFYLSGVETFGAEFAKEQYHVSQVFANLLLLLVGFGALVGVLFAGSISDRLLHRGFLNSRVLVPAIAAVAASLLFIPALVSRSVVTAVPYLAFAAFMLSAQNPPIDAARLDIVPPLLWGRAEGIRTALRTVAQSLAPVIFGASSDHLFGGGRKGLQLTFGILLVVMIASGVILFKALRTYPQDVATAAAGAGLISPSNGGESVGASDPVTPSPPAAAPARSSGTAPRGLWPDPPPPVGKTP